MSNIYEAFDEKLKDVKGTVAIVTHGKVDPDAIASAYALKTIYESNDIDSDFLSRNGPTRPENQSLFHYTDLDIIETDGEKLEDYENISLVDSNLSMLNDNYREIITGKLLDRVFSIHDHHPKSDLTTEILESEEIFADIRTDIGATSTMLTEYLDEYDIDFDDNLATTLLYGIYTDTDNFLSDTVQNEDIEAYSFLRDNINFDIIEEIKSSEYTPETFSIISNVIDNREVRDSYLVSNAGKIESDEIHSLSQAADFVSKMQGVSVSVVSGIDIENCKIEAKIRAKGQQYSAGEIAKDIFGEFGSAGGHLDRGGATVNLNIFKHLLDTDYEEGVFDSVSKAAWQAVGKDKDED